MVSSLCKPADGSVYLHVRESAENERAISLLKKWYECWECAITPDKELERETEALFASVSTEQTPVLPETAIEKDCTQNGNERVEKGQ